MPICVSLNDKCLSVTIHVFVCGVRDVCMYGSSQYGVIFFDACHLKVN